ncbi:MAG TPA: hypothetical protein PKW95_19085 [bacterium]|nr:hypothetical protein [bacterium]
MADCECLAKCPFFNDRMATKPGISDMYKKRYCLGDKSGCARYMIFSRLGREHVPADLYPNQVDRAKQIITA